MIAALALTALASADGGLPLAVYAEKAQLLLPGTGWVESECADADGGCSGVWEPTPRAVVLEKARADEHAQNGVLRQAVPRFGADWWFFMVVSNLATLLAVGYLAWTLKGWVDSR